MSAFIVIVLLLMVNEYGYQALVGRPIRNGSAKVTIFQLIPNHSKLFFQKIPSSPINSN